MPQPDNDTDRIVRQALEQEEAEALRGLEDPSMAELLIATFRGRHRRLAVWGVVLNLLLFAAAVFSSIRFLGTDDVPQMLRWGAATLLCFGLVLAVKVWYWLEMVRLAITRDLKRLELRVSRLADMISAVRGQ
jgi:hypothetical protein